MKYTLIEDFLHINRTYYLPKQRAWLEERNAKLLSMNCHFAAVARAEFMR